MTDKAEEGVSQFYNTVGWETQGDITEDAKRWEDLREHSREYVSKCRLRVLRHIPDHGVTMLDMASGPIQYGEYLEYSRHFEKRYCVDLSAGALEKAKKKIGDRGVFWHGSFFDIPIDENFFDCTISLHTIYHIDKDRQEEAVRKLLHVTKPGKPVIVVYGNPNTLVSSLRSSIPVRLLGRMNVGFACSEATLRRKIVADVQKTLENMAWRGHLCSLQCKRINPRQAPRRCVEILLEASAEMGTNAVAASAVLTHGRFTSGGLTQV